MPFYYLRIEGSAPPKTERDFKYLVYVEKETSNYIEIDGEPGVKFLAHTLNEVPLWNPDDEKIDVIDEHKGVFASFEKIQVVKGFTVWRNNSF